MRRLLACAMVVSALLVGCGTDRALNKEDQPTFRPVGLEGSDTTAVDVSTLISVSLEPDPVTNPRSTPWTVTPSDGAAVTPSADHRTVAFVAHKPGIYEITATGLPDRNGGQRATHTVTVLAPSPSPAPGATDLTAATTAPPTASPEATAEPTISLVLSDGKVPDKASSEVPGFGAAIAELGIRVSSGTEGKPVPFAGSVSNVAFTGQIPPWEHPYRATGGLSVQGTMDPATGAVTGTFTWAVPDLTIIGDVTADGVVLGQATLTMPYTWSGNITGTVGAGTAEIAFSGSRKSTCEITATVETGRLECTGPTGAYEMPVTFAVRVESATPNP
jgi:hypothetical protein